jgi:hypothetical protein
MIIVVKGLLLDWFKLDFTVQNSFETKRSKKHQFLPISEFDLLKGNVYCFSEHGKMRNTLQAITNICKDKSNAFQSLCKGNQGRFLSDLQDKDAINLFPIKFSSLSLT